MNPRNICTSKCDFRLKGGKVALWRSYCKASVCRFGRLVWSFIKNGSRTCVTSLTLLLEVVPVLKWNFSLKSVIILHIISSFKYSCAFFSKTLRRLLLFAVEVPYIKLYIFWAFSSSSDSFIKFGIVFFKVIRLSLFWSRGNILYSIFKNLKASK